MATFGDSEPEDSWHPDDPIPILIDNLLRRLDLLQGRDDLTRRRDLVDEISTRVEQYEAIRSTLGERDRVRLDQLADDLATVRARLDG